ncbi:hypothetical protein BU25DRAFT_424028 [Macroventuria anomochaeta]|uniref:Uncharacterized protein n=1 Tax=Macroventuria anomochaeta TaxID=301207 RepID=A0ACB6RS22_9PLEO|nr:uncharacterized protein BU25DRAFT_424028 [Macroventuria anomochaeta]KAF2624574.1 hypothetical protein BU25DRAFT_424028 [Macroventuria anomochaeta]
MGTNVWTKRFGKIPQKARDSKAYENTRFLTEWSSLIHRYHAAAQKITKARLDSCRNVILSRQQETEEHKKRPHRAQEQKESDGRHEDFNSVLQEVLNDLMWAEAQCHPRAASPINFTTAKLTSIVTLVRVLGRTSHVSMSTEPENESQDNADSILDTLYAYWDEGVKLISERDTDTANEKRVAEYDVARKYLLPATTKIRDLGQGNIGFSDALGRSEMVMRSDKKSARPADRKHYLFSWDNDTVMVLFKE